jgi:predicted nucleic acid-binding protein
MAPVVANASVLIALSRIDRLELLERVGELVIPQAVE